MTDALGLVGSCLEYMSRLHDPAIFKFCAIPQVGGWAGGLLSWCFPSLANWRLLLPFPCA